MFYHISKKNLGKEVTLRPQVPESCCTETEGDIPRICVSISPYYCLKGILGVPVKSFNVFNSIESFRQDLIGMESQEEWIARGGTLLSPSIYTSEEKAWLPPNCSDFRSNKEYWYVRETAFKLQGFIHLDSFIKTGKINIVDYSQEIDGSHITNEALKKLKVIR